MQTCQTCLNQGCPFVVSWKSEPTPVMLTFLKNSLRICPVASPCEQFIMPCDKTSLVTFWIFHIRQEKSPFSSMAPHRVANGDHPKTETPLKVQIKICHLEGWSMSQVKGRNTDCVSNSCRWIEGLTKGCEVWFKYPLLLPLLSPTHAL